MNSKFEMPIYICEDSNINGNGYFSSFRYEIFEDDDNEQHYGVIFEDMNIDGFYEAGNTIIIEKDAMIHGDYTYAFLEDEKNIRFGIFNLDDPNNIVIDFIDNEKEKISYSKEDINMLGKVIRVIK